MTVARVNRVGIICLTMILAVASMSQAKQLARDSELFRKYLSYESILSTPVEFSADQRRTLAVNFAAAETQTTDPNEILAMYEQAGTFVTYLRQSDTSYTWFNNAWLPVDRNTYTYTNNLLTESISQVWEDPLWVNEHKTMTTYSGVLPETSITQDWDTLQTDWVNSGKITFTYDGLLPSVLLIQRWDTDSLAWANQTRVTSTYSGGHLESQLTESWQSGAWTSSLRFTYTYDGEGRISTILTEYWPPSLPVDSTRSTYTYDGSGNNTVILSEHRTGGAWVNSTKFDYEYDGSGHEILGLYSLWFEPNWLALDADTSKYSGDRLVEIVSYNVLTTALTRIQYTHDGPGNLIADLSQTWDGNDWINNERNVYVYITAGIFDDADSQLPAEFELLNNYPNPFNAETVIEYVLKRDGLVTVSVCNILGQTVVTLVDGEQYAGRHRMAWDGRNTDGTFAPSGIYFARVHTGDFTQTRKMVLLK